MILPMQNTTSTTHTLTTDARQSFKLNSRTEMSQCITRDCQSFSFLLTSLDVAFPNFPTVMLPDVSPALAQIASSVMQNESKLQSSPLKLLILSSFEHSRYLFSIQLARLGKSLAP